MKKRVNVDDLLALGYRDAHDVMLALFTTFGKRMCPPGMSPNDAANAVRELWERGYVRFEAHHDSVEIVMCRPKDAPQLRDSYDWSTIQ